jgi:hypothetical protein
MRFRHGPESQQSLRLPQASSVSGLDSPRQQPNRGAPESGYAYIMALFMILTVIIGSTAAMQSLLTSGRRQREEEMIWRGNQYVRAIRLYYRKTGHYPQSLDDLKKGMPQLHFLRYAAYKDPMNREDGTWRFIYVNAAGQIIGSVHYATLQQMALLDLHGGQLPTAQQGAQAGQLGVPASSLASPPSPEPALNPQNPQNPQGPQNVKQPGPLAGGGQLENPLTQLKPTGPVSGPVLGAFIDGVASTVDKTSLKVYKRGKKYNEWEFIWNPMEEQATALQQGLNPAQQGQPGQPGQPIGPGAAGTGLVGNPGSSSPNGNGDAGGNNGLGAPAAPPGASPSPLGPAPQPPPQSPP